MARELKIRVTADNDAANRALGQTEAHLKGIETGATKADKAVGKEGSGLVGSVGMLAKAFIAVGAARAVGSTIEWAGKLSDLSAKTGITTEGLQRLAFAGGQAGVSLDAMASGVTMLQRRLSTDKGAQQAITDLGLSVSDLLAMKPDQMFIALSTAIRNIEDPAKRTTAAFEVMGRSSSELIPVMVSDMQALGDSALIMSDRSTRGLEILGDVWDAFKFSVVSAIGIVVGSLASLLGWFTEINAAAGLTFPQIAAKAVSAFFTVKKAIADAIAFFAQLPVKVTEFARQTYEGVKTWLLDKFAAVVKQIGDKVAAVSDFFKDMWKKVVGGSYVPDMIRGIALWFGKLGAAMVQPSKDATALVQAEFLKTRQVLADVFGQVSQAIAFMGQSMQGGARLAMDAMAGIAKAAQAMAQGVSAASAIASFGISMVISGLVQYWQQQQRFTQEANDIAADLRRLGAQPGDFSNAMRGVDASDPARRFNALQAMLQRWRVMMEIADRHFVRLNEGVQQFGRVAPAALQPMIAQLLRVNRLTEEQRAMLEGMSGEHTWEELQAAAERYGIAVDSLGSRFQSNRLTSGFDRILSDFTMLTDGGADATAVLTGMADEVQALLNDARRFGTALPEFMRPLLQQMIDLGLLTDGAGGLLKDLSGFKFDASLVSSIDKMTAALERLIDLLAYELPGAASKGAKGLAPLPFNWDKLYGPGGTSAPPSTWEDPMPRIRPGGPPAFAAPFDRTTQSTPTGDIHISIDVDGQRFTERVTVPNLPGAKRVRFGTA